MEDRREDITIYTDGSCHVEYKIGAWAAIILYNGQERIIKGIEHTTTHQRMELTAVIQALHYVSNHFKDAGSVQIITDSQYVTQLPDRLDRIITSGFITKTGKKIRNDDLLKEFSILIEKCPATFKKIKAHQKEGEQRNLNRTVDKLVRKLLREQVAKMVKM